MTLPFIFIICLANVLSYNLDYKHPLIYSDNSSNSNAQHQGSYFGFSVLLIPEWETFEPTLIVGAPRGNHSELGKFVKEPGVVYQCPLSGKCRVISSTSESPPDIATKIGMYAKIVQDNGWFGMSISALHPTLLKICAPRTKINLFKPFTNQYIETMQGMCYFYYSSNDTSFLQIETESLTTYNFSSHHWYNPLHGFSQNVARGIPSSINLSTIEKSESIIRSFLKNTSMIVGNPSGSVNIIEGNKRKTLVVSNYKHEQAEFGYSVTSGRFFNKNEILFVGGAPVWKLSGKVAIINGSTHEPTILKYLYGNDLGEYFGACLATGDLNNDGFDDLIVGAPHFGDDFGKAYIYLGAQDAFLNNNPITIEGDVMRAQFGYALASGDLDRDGFDDLIIGAPWEETGVIYIYNGNSVLGEDNNLLASQRIAAVDVSKDLIGFGISISNLVDVDKNEFADLAVGVYKSGHAVIFRANPVEITHIDLKVQPTVIKKGVTTRVSPEFCMKNYKSAIAEIVKNYTVKITVDSKYNRFMYDDIVWHIPITEKTYQVFQYRYSRQTAFSRLTNPHWNGCTTSHFSMKPEIHNTVDPVDIILTYEFNTYRINATNNDTDAEKFCKFCPMTYKGRELKTIKLLVPFETDCGKDKVCSSDISVTTSTFGVDGENNTWEVGSGDVSIEAKFQNHGEPAYSVVATFLIPKIIHLRSILPFCQETIMENLLVVTCNIGHPLNKHSQKTIKLDLDMRDFETHNLTDIESHKLFINMTVKTSTNNEGVKHISTSLTFRNNVSFSMTGKTLDESYFFTDDEQETGNVSFQHIYNIYKNGPTQISDGSVIIDVPISIDHNEPFIFINKAQLQVLGLLYSCITNNIPVQSYTSRTELENSTDNNYKFINIYKTEKRNTLPINEDTEKNFIETGIPNSVRNTEKNSNNTFFMNCFNDRVQCGTVICDLAVLKKPQNVEILLSFSLKIKFLDKILPIGSILEYSTRAQTEIFKPLKKISEVLLTTKFYKMKNTNLRNSTNIWITIISIIVGFIISSLISTTLYYMGFFKKKQRSSTHYTFLNINEREHDQYFLELQDDQSRDSDRFSLNSG